MYPDNGYAALAYFGSDVRTPIMKAGRTQTLLKIRYKGAERLVEPYALKYQQKRDGTEREYLYVYSVTGGESGPGVKSLIAENMSSAENTDIPFVPRSGFQIELCKSGELPENPYRFDPNKPAKREPSPRKRSGFYRSRSSDGIKYMYRCSTCGKKFTRSTTRGRTRVHKKQKWLSVLWLRSLRGY